MNEKTRSSGESGGGAYPDPREPKKEDGFMGHGGQTDMAYHGHGRLGDAEVGGNANALAENEDDRDDGRGD